MRHIRLLGLAFILGLFLGAVTGCANLFTNKNIGLPPAPQMQADCNAGAPAACDVYNLLSGACNGTIAIPISSGNIEQAVCVGLGYRTTQGAKMRFESGGSPQ